MPAALLLAASLAAAYAASAGPPAIPLVPPATLRRPAEPPTIPRGDRPDPIRTPERPGAGALTPRRPA